MLITNTKMKDVKTMLGITGRAGFCKVTPELANKLLEYNTNNRKISEGTIKKYAEQMKEGKWRPDSSAITFDNNVELSNGQHRLKAVIMSGTPVEFLFAFGIDNHSEMDRGKARNIKDNISTDKSFSQDIRESTDIQQIATVLVRLLNGGRASTDDVKDILKLYGDDLLKLRDEGLFKGSHCLNAKSVSAALFVAYKNGVELDLLKRLRNILTSGLISEQTDVPIIALRDKLLTLKGGGQAVEKSRYNLTLFCVDALERGLIRKRCIDEKPKYTLNIK